VSDEEQAQGAQGTADAVADLWARVYGPEPLKVKVLVARSRAAARVLNAGTARGLDKAQARVELAQALLKDTMRSRLNPSRWERLPGRDTRWRVLHALEARPSSLDVEPKPKAVKPPPTVCRNGLHPIDPEARFGERRCEECLAAYRARREATLKLDQTKCRLGKHEGHPRVKCKPCAAERASRLASRQRARVARDREMGLTPAKKRASRSYALLGYK
jgi:hypothetical protein